MDDKTQEASPEKLKNERVKGNVLQSEDLNKLVVVFFLFETVFYLYEKISSLGHQMLSSSIGSVDLDFRTALINVSRETAIKY